MQKLLAQNTLPLYPSGGFKVPGFGSGDPQDAGTIFNKFISSTIGLLTVIAGIWFIFQFIIGAIGILTSGGDKASLASAKSKITYGIIGLVIVIVSIFIIDLIGRLLGLDILNPIDAVIPRNTTTTPGAPGMLSI